MTARAGGSIAALMQVRDYRRLLAAGVWSNLGRWSESLFVGVFVFSVTGSPLLTAVAAMLRFLPLAAVGLFSGAIADRFGRKRLLMWITAIAGAATAIQFLLAALGALEVWHVCIGALAAGLHWATEMPARRTMLGQAVATGLVGPAMALDSAANNATRMAGPLLGGVALGVVDIAFAFLFVTVLHVLSFLSVRGCDDLWSGRSVSKFVGQVTEVLRLVRMDRMFIGIFLVTLIFNLFAFPPLSMIPVIGEEGFGLTPMAIGVLSSAEGMGSFIGAMLIGRFATNRANWQLLYWGGLLLSLCMALAFAFSPTPQLAFAALLAMGLGVGGYSVMQNALIIAFVREELRNRYMGLMSFGIGFAPLGYLALGWMADWIGPRLAICAMTAAGAAALGAMMIRYPEIWRWINEKGHAQ